MSERGDEHTVGVFRINDDRADLLSVAQPHIPPGLPAVGRFVNAVAGRKIGALQTFAAADVNNVGIGRRDSQIADRPGRLVIEDRSPRQAIIGRLPHASVVDADVEDVRLPRNARSADSASRAERPDASPAQRLIEIVVVLLSGYFKQPQRRRSHERKQNSDKQCTTSCDHRFLHKESVLKLVPLLSKFSRFYTRLTRQSRQTPLCGLWRFAKACTGRQAARYGERERPEYRSIALLIYPQVAHAPRTVCDSSDLTCARSGPTLPPQNQLRG